VHRKRVARIKHTGGRAEIVIEERKRKEYVIQDRERSSGKIVTSLMKSGGNEGEAY